MMDVIQMNLALCWNLARDIFVGKSALHLISKPIVLFIGMSALGR
jgi:hypothetical protein